MLGIRTAAASLACAGAWSGCSFESPKAAPDAPPGEDAGVLEPDAPPDAAFVPACMTDPTYANNGAHRYKVVPRDVDYDGAIDACAADGAHLAVVDSAAENQYLASLATTAGAWIGLDDLTVEGTFRWLAPSPAGFRAFPTGEPNNYFGEDCTLIVSNGTWNDAGCEYPRRPICECEPAYRPPPTPLCRTLQGGFQLQSGRRLFPRPMARTWQAAEDDCRAIGAHLLVIGDGDENGEMDLRFGPIWIGYSDLAAEGKFEWVDGSPATYHRFGAAPPANDGLDCAVLQDFGGWANVACGESRPYVCECDPAAP
jgi:hypothetical protein